MKKNAPKKLPSSRRKTAAPASTDEGELLSHYDFDYAKAKPNPFAASCPPGGRLVVLEADVAEVFPDAESVNAVLRALITTMPRRAG